MKTNVYICADAHMAAIFLFSKWPPQNKNFGISQPLIDIETSLKMLFLCRYYQQHAARMVSIPSLVALKKTPRKCMPVRVCQTTENKTFYLEI